MVAKSISKKKTTEIDAVFEEVYQTKHLRSERYQNCYHIIYRHCDVYFHKNNGKGREDHSIRDKIRLIKKIENCMKSFLRNLVIRSSSIEDEKILEFYESEWKDYHLSSKTFDSICEYLNRHWVTTEDSNTTQRHNHIYKLALRSWKSCLLKKLNKRLTNAALKLIDCERRGGEVNTALIQNLKASYFESETTQEDGMNTYKNCFEWKFLEETKIFYINAAEPILENNLTMKYLTNIKLWFREEKNRVASHLCNSTEEPLKDLFEGMVENSLELLSGTFKKFLETDQKEDLKLMYSLIDHIPSVVDKLGSRLEQHFILQGQSAIKKYNESTDDPEVYVSTILEVREKFSSIVSELFNNNDTFVYALDRALTSFVNSPEVLAKHCDVLLKTSKNRELDDAVDRVMVIFRYLPDKDLFQNFYFKFLAKRLLHPMTVSKDGEQMVISKLEDICGALYVQNLRRIIDDEEGSREFNKKFRCYLRKHRYDFNFEFNVQLLLSDLWPFRKSAPVTLPIECNTAMDAYTSFFRKDTPKRRKLCWLFNLSVAEITTNGYKKQFTVVGDTYQAAVLLLFNDSDDWTVDQLSGRLNMEIDAVLQTVEILVQSNLVTCAQGEKLTSDSLISVNKEFNNEDERVNLNVSVEKEYKIERKRVQKKVSGNRNEIVRAAIVRSMKADKILTHKDLIEKVLVRVAEKFSPSEAFIVKHINNLIAEGYLKKIEKVYHYLP